MLRLKKKSMFISIFRYFLFLVSWRSFGKEGGMGGVLLPFPELYYEINLV